MKSTCLSDKLVNIYLRFPYTASKAKDKSQYFFVFVGVIYLKNLITSNWADKEVDSGPIEFSIHEQDRAMIRDAIVDAVVHAPDLIRQVAI